MKRVETFDVPSLRPEQLGDPCIMVIFGASGDLTKRKLIPALYNLAKEEYLPRRFALVGIARSPMNSEQFRDKLTADMNRLYGTALDGNTWREFVGRLHYLSGSGTDENTYLELKDLLTSIDADYKTGGNYFYYLATSPDLFSPIVQHLGRVSLAREENDRWRRIIIEKPFGHDLDSARSLNRELRDVLSENQIYRIDHYLGKETVQTLLVFRFGNGIFEPVWNRNYIDHVQITAAEDLGVEGRGAYYEGAGALRDMVPNHILQLITLTAMEPPMSFAADAVRNEQAKILNAIQPLSSEQVITDTVRGQYGPGSLNGDRVVGYRSENRVAATSHTETFVAAKFSVDNWRWNDVPFYLRTGKRLSQRLTEIVIQFKRAPFMLFRKTSVEHLTSNRLIVHVQPDEGISLRFWAKVPGPIVSMGAVNMEFRYADYFGTSSGTGYERLLYDCMIGDATLFQRTDMVEAGWSVVEPIIDVWKALPPRSFPNYTAGTWGPKESDDLIERDGRRWVAPLAGAVGRSSRQEGRSTTQELE
ncbi:MAG TPA: glucose-6-phosphate dehydrogenase [Pyrinomonadaceae bacterium]|nr:glucose-6-phosphate dehydrogenase [Pyrinomonadaceae bacterium]